MYSLHRRYLVVSFCFMLLSTLISAQSSCMPLNCVAQCRPNCSGADVCVLSTMSNCGQCPASSCMSPSALGISSPANNNSSHATPTTSNQQGENNDSLIGGLVGGLVGAGLLIGGLAICIFRSRKRRSLTLPFQSTVPYQPQPQQQQQQQRQRQQQQQQQQQQQLNDIVDDKSIIYPSLSDIPSSIFETTRDSTCHSITSGVIPVAYIPPSNEMQQLHTNNVTTTTATATATAAGDNPFQDPHHSLGNPHISLGSNKDNDDDGDDMSSRHHSILSADQHTSNYAIQVTRTKPLILRVSSLKRNGSEPTLPTKPNHEGIFLARSNTIDLVTTMSSGVQDPFQNNHDAIVNQHDDGDLDSSRPSMNHSLGSTLGDGEITIFWHGQQQQD